MDVWAKYTKKFGGGAGWNYVEGATYHAAEYGHTLCGRGRPHMGGPWELLRGRSKLEVTCSACRRKLGLKPLEN